MEEKVFRIEFVGGMEMLVSGHDINTNASWLYVHKNVGEASPVVFAAPRESVSFIVETSAQAADSRDSRTINASGVS